MTNEDPCPACGHPVGFHMEGTLGCVCRCTAVTRIPADQERNEQ